MTYSLRIKDSADRCNEHIMPPEQVTIAKHPRRRAGLIALGVWAAFAILSYLVFESGMGASTWVRLLLRHESAQALVSRIDRTWSWVDFEDEGRLRIWRVQLTFRTTDGREVATVAYKAGRPFEPPETGATTEYFDDGGKRKVRSIAFSDRPTIAVEYSPGDPRICRIKDAQTGIVHPKWAIFMPFLFVAVCGIVAGVRGQAAKRSKPEE